MEFKVIGVGGIGGALAAPLCRYLSHKDVGSPVKVTLIDGDKYEPKNAERQNCGHSDFYTNKARAETEKLREQFMGRMALQAVEEYITEHNLPELVQEHDVILCGVDNHKTRYLLAKHCETLDNITLISGGNEMTDGNVMIFLKRDGKKLTANLDEYHKEIAEPADKSPHELGCADVVVAHPQIYFMNLQIASLMLTGLFNILESTNLEDIPGEVYTDIKEMKTVPRTRRPKAIGGGFDTARDTVIG